MIRAALPAILSLFLTSVLGCMTPSSSDQSTAGEDMVMAKINGEILTQSEFDETQALLPPFARQLESDPNIQISRFWSLIQMILMAQDARQKQLLSPAERSLAIKEALAQYQIQSIISPDQNIGDDEIEQYQTAHPDEFIEPSAFTVNYSLVKNDKTIRALGIGWHMLHSAQLGYNFTHQEERPKTVLKHSIQSINEKGRFIPSDRFSYVYTVAARENTESFSQIGPFALSDGVLFSCPETIKRLNDAPLNMPINENMACSGEWKAFVIPIWKRPQTPMEAQKARQIAIEKIRSRRNMEYRSAYLKQRMGETK